MNQIQLFTKSQQNNSTQSNSDMNASAIAQTFRTTLFSANVALSIIRGRINPLDFPRRFPKTYDWAWKCYTSPRTSEIKLEALNELLETCGVESIECEHLYINKYYGHNVASYLNVGETYTKTLMLSHLHKMWKLISCGDFVESLDVAQWDECEE